MMLYSTGEVRIKQLEAVVKGYRDALSEIMVRCQQGNEPQAAMTRAHHVARRALGVPSLAPAENQKEVTDGR